MDIEGLIELIKKSSQHNYLYHFTDKSNFPSIRRYGILSKKLIEQNDILPNAMGGNDLSHTLDSQRGIDSFVSLCVIRDHPMKYIAHDDGRLPDPHYLAIDPGILEKEGIKIAFDIANKKGVHIHELEDVIDDLDVEVIYSRTDWKDPKVQERLQIAKRLEILIPDCVPASMIKKVFS